MSGQPSIVIQNVQAAPAEHVAAIYVPIKSAGLAVVLSFFVTGLGQIYNGEVGKGILLLVLQFVNIPLWFVGLGVFIAFGLWIYSMVDAHAGALRVNMQGR